MIYNLKKKNKSYARINKIKNIVENNKAMEFVVVYDSKA